MSKRIMHCCTGTSFLCRSVELVPGVYFRVFSPKSIPEDCAVMKAGEFSLEAEGLQQFEAAAIFRNTGV